MVDVFLSPAIFQFYGGERPVEYSQVELISNVVEYELARNFITTSRNEPGQTLVEALAKSNAEKARAHISIQTQKDNGQSRGAQIFFNRQMSNSERLADDVYIFLEKILPYKGLGICDSSAMNGGKGLYELINAKAPAIIVCPGFHDNALDLNFIKGHIYELGCVIAMGVLKYFAKPYKADSRANTDKLTKAYNCC